jgi:hypothetical protein
MVRITSILIEKAAIQRNAMRADATHYPGILLVALSRKITEPATRAKRCGTQVGRKIRVASHVSLMA